MRILAVDTATPSCSVAVTDNGTLLAEITALIGRSHAGRVMVMIRNVLEMAGSTVGEVDGFAVSHGPGSFTGLRIGISSVKGLALASGKPIVGVSGLRVLAAQAAAGTELICPMMDARKGQVYHAFYGLENGSFKKLGKEKVMSPEKTLEGIHEPCMFTGPGAIVYRDRIAACLGALARFSPHSHGTPRASTLAGLAGERLANGDADHLAGFVPVYIRKSDAELNFKR